MRKLYPLLAAALLISFTAKESVSFNHPAGLNHPAESKIPAPWPELKTAEDKAFLLDYFKETSDNLLKSLKGLTRAQLQFKPAADRWSVGQCVEHIVLTEEMLLGMVDKLMQEPANPERKDEVKAADQDIIDGMVDRSQTAQASDELQPEGTYSSESAAVKAFTERRAKTIEYIENASVEDLRNHVTDSPFGAVDAYQFLLFISAHAARHTAQLEEVKADPGFPGAE